MSNRKLALTQWFFRNNDRAFRNSLKVQKFLFFYEIFSKVSNKEYSLERLELYEKGPVFSAVYGDYRYNYYDLVGILSQGDVEEYTKIDVELAKKASFLVSILNTDELSDLTHLFDLWKKRFSIKGYRIGANEEDFSEEDAALAQRLLAAYPLEFIEHSTILYLDPAKFVIATRDVDKLTKEHYQALEDIAFSEERLNPMFITLAEDGVLEID